MGFNFYRFRASARPCDMIFAPTENSNTLRVTLIF